MYGLNAVRVMLRSTSSEIATRRRRITSTLTGSIAAGAGAGVAAGAGAVSMTAVNVDLPELADAECVARADQRARPILDDQRRTLALEAVAERIAIINLRRQECVLFEEEDRPHSK